MVFVLRMSGILVLSVSLLLCWRCERAFDVLHPEIKTEDAIVIEAGYLIQVEKCNWKGGKRSAYTISFDDTRMSHLQTSAPELNKRGMVGTFSLNTKNVVNWSDWRGLALTGHELASHTYSHIKCTEVSEEELRQELSRAVEEILLNVPEINRVPSFTYPYGLFDEATHKIVQQYHVSARAGWGVNGSDFSDEDLMRVKGVGVYPPYDMAAINRQVDQAVRSGGWILVYFHSVSVESYMDQVTIPLEGFLQHIDYVKALQDSLWMATQGDVADYIRLRRDAVVNGHLVDRQGIRLSIENIPRGLPEQLSLSLAMALPLNWQGHDVILYNLKTEQADTIKTACDPLRIDLPQKTKLHLYAVKK